MIWRKYNKILLEIRLIQPTGNKTVTILSRTALLFVLVFTGRTSIGSEAKSQGQPHTTHDMTHDYPLLGNLRQQLNALRVSYALQKILPTIIHSSPMPATDFGCLLLHWGSHCWRAAGMLILGNLRQATFLRFPSTYFHHFHLSLGASIRTSVV